MGQNALGAKFSFKINNASAAKVVIAIFAAYFNTLKVLSVADAGTGKITNTLVYSDPSEIVAAGYACDAVLDDGEIMPGVTCTSSNSKMSIRQFKNYIRGKGNVVMSMTIAASNSDCFDEELETVVQTPLMGSAPVYLNLTEGKSTTQFDQLKAEFPNLQLITTQQTLSLLPIKAGRELTITLSFAYA